MEETLRNPIAEVVEPPESKNIVKISKERPTMRDPTVKDQEDVL